MGAVPVPFRAVGRYLTCVKRQTIIQLVGAGLVALVVACVVVVMVFKEEHIYTCNNTNAERVTLEFKGVVLSEKIYEHEESEWVRSVHPKPLEHEWIEGYVNWEYRKPSPRVLWIRELYRIRNAQGSEDLLLRLLDGPSLVDFEFMNEIGKFCRGVNTPGA